jgi:hypothetical protein
MLLTLVSYDDPQLLLLTGNIKESLMLPPPPST